MAERCWMKVADAEQEAEVARQTEALQVAIRATLKTTAGDGKMFTLSVLSALMTEAATLFAHESVECENSDAHIEQHIDEAVEKFTQYVGDCVANFRVLHEQEKLTTLHGASTQVH